MEDAENSGVARRAFLKGAAAAGAAIAAMPASAQAAQEARSPANTAEGANRQGGKFITRPGSDFMVDVIKSLGIKYVASCPASSFRSLHESFVNYGGNKDPEFISCLHEESSAAIAHGYFKAAGKPLAICAHGTVGLQHAAMGVYNAWCDRVPMLVIGGNVLDAAKRRPGVEWYHCAQDPAALMRDFMKWDDQPVSLQHFADSTVRAYKMAMAPPMAPVMISCDLELQESPIEQEAVIPKVVLSAPPQADMRMLEEAARLLVNAEHPVLIADRTARSQEGVQALVALAEALQAPVVSTGNRFNFPTMHPLHLSDRRKDLVREADVILMLEVSDPWSMLNDFGDPWKEVRPVAHPDLKLIHITLEDFIMKSNLQDMQRFVQPTLPISGDSQVSLPLLVEAVKRLASAERRMAFAQRGEQIARQHAAMIQAARQAASYGWEASPISTGRLAAEVWNAVRHEPWSLVVTDATSWPKRLWDATDFAQMLGGSGGYGVGYSAPAAVGAALANRDKGLLSVVIQPDGDLLFAPGVLWTAAHHKIPLLMVMFNNQAYGQEVMHLQRMANLHQRDPRTSRIGTMMWDPEINFSKIAEGHGVWAEGPITDPNALGPALQRALKVVKGGAPALVDVICQLR
jgi:benzoylformate decarboxylase/acetolactate synthase-1/2/3 large subunit